MSQASQTNTGTAQKASGSQSASSTNASLNKSAGASAMNAAAQAASAVKKPGRPATKPQSAVQLLKADHRKAEQLFAQYANTEEEEQKTTLVKQVCKELIIHTMLEEEIFYAACREKGVESDLMDEAQVEHDSAKLMIQDLLQGEPEDEFYDAKVKVLSEYIKHHVGEEEKPRNGIFAKAQKAGLDMEALGQTIQERKQELMEEIDENDLEAPEPRSIHIGEGSQEDYMARNSNDRDRDDRGRFTSDDDDDDRRYSSRGRSSSRYDDDRDDDRGYSSRSRGNPDQERDSRGRFTSDDDDGRGYSSRGRSSSRYDDDDDDRRSSSRDRSQGGWFGDSEGHSEAAERGWESRGSRGSSRSRDDDDDDRGSSRGRSSRSRDDDDDDRSSSPGRSQGGWFGDSRGHSEAAERGWEHRGGGSRGSSRSRDDDDDDRRSSRSSSSSGGGRSSGGRGQGGWFGDSEGHSEAAEKGWEHRSGSRGSSRSRDDDDDDDRRSSSSRGRSHGGWFGDSRGHSEAARRGRGRD